MDFGENHFSSGIGESDDEVEIHIDWASFQLKINRLL